MRFLLFSVVFWGCVCAHGYETFRPQSPEELSPSIHRERAVFVPGTRVVWADYVLLKRDFGQLAQLSDRQIDDWLVHNFAYVGETQLLLNGIRNSPIPTEGGRWRWSFRPFGHQRGMTMEADGGGMADLKGSGNASRPINGLSPLSAVRPGLQLVQQLGRAHGAKPGENLDWLREESHGDGLMSLGEALAELTRQRALQQLFDLENAQKKTGYQTVESYFVLHLPFSILKPGNEHIPAAIYGRQAHAGRLNLFGRDLDPPTDHIYVDPAGNRQASLSGAAVDMGGVRIRDARLAEKFTPRLSPQEAYPWSRGHEIARWVSTSDTDHARHLVAEHVADMLSPLKADWDALGSRPMYNAAPPGTDGWIQTMKYWNYLVAKHLDVSPLPHILALRAPDDPRLKLQLFHLAQGWQGEEMRDVAMEALASMEPTDEIRGFFERLPAFRGRFSSSARTHFYALAAQGSRLALTKYLPNFFAETFGRDDEAPLRVENVALTPLANERDVFARLVRDSGARRNLRMAGLFPRGIDDIAAEHWQWPEARKLLIEMATDWSDTLVHGDAKARGMEALAAHPEDEEASRALLRAIATVWKGYGDLDDAQAIVLALEHFSHPTARALLETLPMEEHPEHAPSQLRKLIARAEEIEREVTADEGALQKYAEFLRQEYPNRDEGRAVLWALRGHFGHHSLAATFEELDYRLDMMAQLIAFRHTPSGSSHWRRKAFGQLTVDVSIHRWMSADAAHYLAQEAHPDDVVMAALRAELYDPDMTPPQWSRFLRAMHRHVDRDGVLDLLLEATGERDLPELVQAVPRERLLAALEAHPSTRVKQKKALLEQRTNSARARGRFALLGDAFHWAKSCAARIIGAVRR